MDDSPGDATLLAAIGERDLEAMRAWHERHAAWLSVRLSKLMTAPAAPAAGASAAGVGVLVRVLPFVTVVIAAFIPLAAGIYLLASTGWALAERAFFWKTGRIPGALPSPERAPVAARDRA